MVNDKFRNFFKGKKVFITGHTGFKGSWLCILLHSFDAEVYGYALEPPTNPNLFQVARVEKLVRSTYGDVRDYHSLCKSLHEAQPDIVIHMAAQPLVRDSYKIPVETYAVNVMGTVHLLDACRSVPSIKAIVNVTTDKCYENKEWHWGYRENEPMNGYDPYSNSKSCSELVTSAFHNSYFNSVEYKTHGVGLASARAGNVIGGGDWANDRLIPDFIKAISNGNSIAIRNPDAIRPWQHVLEPLSGYLLLAMKLCEDGSNFAGGWNFGPEDKDAHPVKYIVEKLCALWDGDSGYSIQPDTNLHEANYLKLDCSKAKHYLKWAPVWDLDIALSSIVEWYKMYLQNENMYDVCRKQINQYFNNSK